MLDRHVSTSLAQQLLFARIHATKLYRMSDTFLMIEIMVQLRQVSNMSVCLFSGLSVCQCTFIPLRTETIQVFVSRNQHECGVHLTGYTNERI